MVKLRAVPATEETPVVDIYANWKAEVAARDWGAMHVAADRRQPLDMPDPRRRTWRR